MCGISGLIDTQRHSSHESLRVIGDKMNLMLSHRGPDASGIWIDPVQGIVLGHRRLSVIDLDGGAQPMISSCGRYILTFNGELYNFLSIRKELEREGHSFRDNSDTEVFLMSLICWPLEVALKKATGMFAFALWDRVDKRLTLGRDRFGEKPLYYGWIEKKFVFASELKAFSAIPKWEKSINRNALSAYCRHNYVPEPYSIFDNIFKLLPGHFIVLDNDHLLRDQKFSPYGDDGDSLRWGPRPYWSQSKIEESQSPSAPQSKLFESSGLEQILLSTIENKLISDVPLGALLSGGIDSSLIVALTKEVTQRQVKTFTVGFDAKQYDEAEHARGVASYLGTEHHELYVTADDAQSIIPELSSIYDEPFADSSQIPTVLISRLARQEVTVALSGDGGDEVFGGYNRYIWGKRLFKGIGMMPLLVRQQLARAITSVSPDHWTSLHKLIPYRGNSRKEISLFGDKLYKVAHLLQSKDGPDMYKRLISICQNPNELVLDSKEVNAYLDCGLLPQTSDELAQYMMLLDQRTYLPGDILAKVDRASMSVGLEIRAPFLDHKVVEYAQKIPVRSKIEGGIGKRVLREVLYRYVPRQLIDRPKMGFAVPLSAWLRGPLKPWADELLQKGRIEQEGFFDGAVVRNLWRDHQSGKHNREYQLWGLLMFQSWLENQ